jgi:hypothetical protein
VRSTISPVVKSVIYELALYPTRRITGLHGELLNWPKMWRFAMHR